MYYLATPSYSQGKRQETLWTIMMHMPIPMTQQQELKLQHTNSVMKKATRPHLMILPSASIRCSLKLPQVVSTAASIKLFPSFTKCSPKCHSVKSLTRTATQTILQATIKRLRLGRMLMRANLLVKIAPRALTIIKRLKHMCTQAKAHLVIISSICLLRWAMITTTMVIIMYSAGGAKWVHMRKQRR